MDAIAESLQNEFCPPLDSSLLAALIAEIDLDDLGDDPYTSIPIVALRNTLIQLAAHADESQGFDDFSCSDETTSSPDFCTTTATTSASDLSGLSLRSSFNSPLGFLQAALPHIQIERLVKALSAAGTGAGDDIDMWEIISGILSEEEEREMRERDLDEDEMGIAEAPWETVETKKNATPRKGKKKSARGNKITLSDVRQQQHARPTLSRPRTEDPWSQLASLSTHVATFLPPHPASFFQSFFHSPEHARTPYDALCAALNALCTSSPTDSAAHTSTLFNLLDLLLPSYTDLDSDGRTRLITDIELALSAAQGRGEDAFELVKVLRDLDSDAAAGAREIGVYHLPSPVVSPSPRSAPPLPAGPAPTPPPRLKPPILPPAAPTPAQRPSVHQWQAVPPRRRPLHAEPHPLAMHIPAYAKDVNGVRVQKGGGGGGGGNGELGAYRRRVGESMRRRDELLREAARMWQRGNKRSRGGEVAFYFAERAREFQEVAKREALDAARVMVESKRFASRDRDTVDLHGVTSAEAVVIVEEILREQTWSTDKPLKIITGRGAHSANQVSVLKPAVRKALVEDGWIVGSWDGGLVVRGRRGRGVS